MACDGREKALALQREELHLRAARGDGRGAGNVAQERDLAEVVAGPQRPLRRLVDRDLDLSRGDDVEAVAVLSLPDDRLAGADANRLEPRGEPFQNRRWERREDRDRAQEVELASVVDRGVVEPDERDPRGERERREDRADRDERPAHAYPVDEQRREDRPGGDGC